MTLSGPTQGEFADHDGHALTRVTQALALVGRITRANTAGNAVEALQEAVEPFGVSTDTASIAANPKRMHPGAGMMSSMPTEWTEINLAKRKFLYNPVVQAAARLEQGVVALVANTFVCRVLGALQDPALDRDLLRMTQPARVA